MRLLAAVVLLGSVVAPGAPGLDQQYLPADKAGLITSHSATSKVWATVQREGGLGEIFYPTIGGPAARALRFVVADHHGHAWLATGASTDLADSHSPRYRQTFSGKGWRLTASYVTDPSRDTVLADLALDGRGFDLFAVYDPALGNSRGHDSGRTAGKVLVEPHPV